MARWICLFFTKIYDVNTIKITKKQRKKTCTSFQDIRHETELCMNERKTKNFDSRKKCTVKVEKVLNIIYLKYI